MYGIPENPKWEIDHKFKLNDEFETRTCIVVSKIASLMHTVDIVEHSYRDVNIFRTCKSINGKIHHQK